MTTRIMHGTSLKGDPLVHFYLKVPQTAYRANKNWDDFQVNPIPHRYAFLRFANRAGLDQAALVRAV